MANPFLFSYGTLSDPEYIQLLLRRLPAYEDAVLPGYGLYKHPGNGYLFTRPEAGKQVSGQLFQVTWRELELIDYWEDVPLYEREILTVETASGKPIDAFVYTQKSMVGLPATFANEKSRQEILNDLEDFMESMRRGGFLK